MAGTGIRDSSGVRIVGISTFLGDAVQRRGNRPRMLPTFQRMVRAESRRWGRCGRRLYLVPGWEFRHVYLPRVRRLVSRLVPEPERSEFELIVLAGSHLKLFDKKSEGIDWFEDAVRDRMWVVAPALRDGRLLLDLAIRKGQVDFFTSDAIPKNHQASVFRNVRDNRRAARRRRTSSGKQTPSEIYGRRLSQLRRFFPVTLERLSFDENFQQLGLGFWRRGTSSGRSGRRPVIWC